jgi:hypothetical protein
MILASNSGRIRAEKIKGHSVLFRSQDFYFGCLSFVQGCNGLGPASAALADDFDVDPGLPQSVREWVEYLGQRQEQMAGPHELWLLRVADPAGRPFSVAQENLFPLDRLS